MTDLVSKVHKVHMSHDVTPMFFCFFFTGNLSQVFSNVSVPLQLSRSGSELSGLNLRYVLEQKPTLCCLIYGQYNIIRQGALTKSSHKIQLSLYIVFQISSLIVHTK